MKITAKDVLSKRIIKFPEYEDHNGMTEEDIRKNVIKSMVEFAKLHVEAQAKEIYKKAEDELPEGIWENMNDKNFITNAYPLTNIK